MITRETLKSWRMRFAMHVRLHGGSLYVYQCIEDPRLSRSDHLNKKTRTSTTKWFVGDVECADLDDAIRRLNETSDEQRNMAHG